jgi:hypothetical protein
MVNQRSDEERRGPPNSTHTANKWSPDQEGFVYAMKAYDMASSCGVTNPSTNSGT